MRISDWSSDVCSSDLRQSGGRARRGRRRGAIVLSGQRDAVAFFHVAFVVLACLSARGDRSQGNGGSRKVESLHVGFSAIVEWPSANLQMARQVIRCVSRGGYSQDRKSTV